MQTYETKQPWVVYTFLTPDPGHSDAFDTSVKLECCVCGVTDTITIHVPAVGDERPTEAYPQQRSDFLAAHTHHPLPHALTWAKPLRNTAAHNETHDVLLAVARDALDRAT